MKIPVKTVCGLDVHKDSVFCRIVQAYGQINQHKFGILPDGPMTLRNLMLSEGGGGTRRRALASTVCQSGGPRKELQNPVLSTLIS